MSFLLHIQFDFNGDPSVTFPFDAATKRINALPDLKWKIWALNNDVEGATKGSGFYLYPTREAAEARAIEGKETLPHYPGVSNVTTTIWEVLDDYSLATHAPVNVPLIKDL